MEGGRRRDGLQEKCSRPLNMVENGAQARAFSGIDHLNKADSSCQMQAKVRDSVTVLCSGTKANAICQNSLETIKGGTPHIQMLIDHDSRQMLAHPVAHDARFAMMDFESFFIGDGGNVSGKSTHAFFEIFIARKRKIVCVARVCGTGRFRETSQAAIEPVSTEISEGR